MSNEPNISIKPWRIKIHLILGENQENNLSSVGYPKTSPSILICRIWVIF